MGSRWFGKCSLWIPLDSRYSEKEAEGAARGMHNEFIKDYVHIFEFVHTKSFIWLIIKSL